MISNNTNPYIPQLINDPFYKTSLAEKKLAYQLLNGELHLGTKYSQLALAIQENFGVSVLYIYEGNFINVDHGLYLPGVKVYVGESAYDLLSHKEVCHFIHSHYSFQNLDSSLHKEYHVADADAIQIIPLEKELKTQVENFICMELRSYIKKYDMQVFFYGISSVKNKNSEDLPFINFGYRNETDLANGNQSGISQRIATYTKDLYSANNYFNIFQGQMPPISFIVNP